MLDKGFSSVGDRDALLDTLQRLGVASAALGTALKSLVQHNTVSAEAALPADFLSKVCASGCVGNRLVKATHCIVTF